MASSQVEIASSAPFGCVLKDHNRRERCSRDAIPKAAASTQAAFQKNLKELVRDHLHTCISISSDENSQNNGNNNNSNNDATNHHHHPPQQLRCLANHQEDITKNVDGSSLIGCKHERTLDRWAAKQAQEMVSSIESHSQEAELLIASQKTSSSAVENSHTSRNSVVQPESSSGSSNLGASSLVQIWEARLSRPEPKMDRSNSMKNNQNTAPGPSRTVSRTSSGSSFAEIISSSVEEPPRPSDILEQPPRRSDIIEEPPRRSDTVEEPPRRSDIIEEQPRQSDIIDSAAHEEPLADWDSTAQSSRSSNFRSSDAGEKEKVKIADIIKRLTSESHDQEQGNSGSDPPNRRHSYGSDLVELKALSHIINSPKIRGRQAYNDLLLQMVQERQRELVSLAERQSVSKFHQRGRIQSILRLRCLQRGTAIQEQRSHSVQSTIASDANRSHQSATIMHLREIFTAGVEQVRSSGNDGAATERSSNDTANNIVDNGNPSTVHHVTEDSHHQDTSTTTTATETATASATATATATAAAAEEQVAPPADNSFSQTSEIHEDDVHENSSATSDVTWEGTCSEGNNFDPGEVLESAQSSNNWDGNEMNDEESVVHHDFEESNDNWFADIARPRSYWEDRRQAWYQEMLSTSSENNEIRQLLERRAVSTCLSSDFKEKMDRLMVSRVRIQADCDEQLDEESQERMGQLLLSFFQRHSSSESGSSEEEVQEADEEGREGGEEADEEEYVGGGRLLQVHEEESSPSINSPSQFRSWNYSDHHEVADDSEQIPTAPSQPILPSESSNQDRGLFSPAINSSMGMELIYNLRGHMEQLQLEISELRRSMQTCMAVQAKLLNSFKQEVHPVPEATMNSIDMATKRRICCICYEMQVDSFLYRCGHMCTCLKCAHELQWSSGKCPICRAPILDVVRAYMDS